MTAGRAGRLALGAAAAAVTLGVGVWLGALSGAATAPPPGSSADPLVTRSYVTKAVDGVLAEAGGRVRDLRAGTAFTLGIGTAFVVIEGSASVTAGPQRAGTSRASAPVPLLDLTAGKSLFPAGGRARALALPVAHLLLTGMAGDTVTAGSEGAVLWLLGAEAKASIVAPGAG